MVRPRFSCTSAARLVEPYAIPEADRELHREPSARHAGADLLAALALALALLAGLALAWLVRDAPLAPLRARELLRADALTALILIVAAGHGLADLAHGTGRPRRTATAVVVTGVAAAMDHLGLAGVMLLVAAWLRAARPGPARVWLPGTLPALCTAAGLALTGVVSGEWRFGAPLAGAGLNSASFALLLIGLLLGLDAGALPRRRPPVGDPLVALGCLYGLLRLYSLGPWNLGWLAAAMLLGAAVALWSAWEAAAAPAPAAGPWLALFMGGLALVGAGLGSGAGLTLAGYTLLLRPVVQLGSAPPAPPGRASWLLAAAVPLSGPFVAAWMAVAAAVAGGLTLLAAVVWAAALLAALPPLRLARAVPAPGRPNGDLQAVLAAALSLALGAGSPAVVGLLLRPLVAQLQGGLTPFGELELWPWAGLIAYDAARQPVATLPSIALLALMAVLAALCWVALRLGALRRP